MNQDADVLTEWWLDESALPDLYWARLKIWADGKAEVFDLDGHKHSFSTIDEAREFLRNEEYLPLRGLREDGMLEEEIEPPSFLIPDQELSQHMKRSR